MPARTLAGYYKLPSGVIKLFYPNFFTSPAGLSASLIRLKIANPVKLNANLIVVIHPGYEIAPSRIYFLFTIRQIILIFVEDS